MSVSSSKPEPTRSERIADHITSVVGSLPFVIVQSLFLLCWVALNTAIWFAHPDPYPFILMNLMLSLQAAYTGPFVLISQNRQAALDRRTMERDAEVNRLAEDKIDALTEDMQVLKRMIANMVVPHE